MARKKRELGNDTYFTVFNSDLKLIKDPVKKILYAKIKNWIYRNEDKESEYHNKAGYWWTYGSYEHWGEDCGLDMTTVGNHLRELVATGILKTGNYNKMKIDKTIWYRLATEDELKKVNFRLLFYGKSKEKNINNHRISMEFNRTLSLEKNIFPNTGTVHKKIKYWSLENSMRTTSSIDAAREVLTFQKLF